MQGGRNSHQRHTALQHALGQLLDKKRYAVGAVCNLSNDFVGQCSAPGDLLDQSSSVGSVQCASSKTMITGCWRAKPTSWRSSASNVFSFLRCGLRLGGGWRSEIG